MATIIVIHNKHIKLVNPYIPHVIAWSLNLLGSRYARKEGKRSIL